ncbi:MAG TPA: carboxylesterase family protein, partial [Gemmatimonadaceae bacterium]|nr:carboxylesterase family protein [Gemmatimonadaceae bacterium]
MAPVPQPRVQTASGTVEGVQAASGIREFRGIPFAAPPVRELRWRPPQPVARWSGVRRADRFAAQCMQARVFDDMVFRNAGVSEDCLYLNVWAPPAAAGARLPVLVYFYGGGYVAGDGSEPRYDGESMAKRGMVVVTTSYRLGVFGFLAHPELTRESPHHASGNYALLDQVAALRWVHDNIAAFGGDPSRVTIGGESAGSFSVSALMASPLSRDLIAGAIGESGAFFSQTIPTPSRADAEQTGVAFATAAGAHSLAELRALSAMELLAASMRRGAPRVGPDVDGWFLPAPPESIYAAGRQAHVPLLAGWNSEESGPGGVLRGQPATPENVARLVDSTFGASAAEAARYYPATTPEQAVQSATDLASDRFIAYSTWRWLEAQSATGGHPVYRYFYAHPRPAPAAATLASSPPPPAPRGAVHSAEIEYALGNLATNRVYDWTSDDHAVSETMETYFANFVKHGDPNGPGVPAWPVGSVGADGGAMRMRIDVVSRAEPEPRARYLFLE